MFISVPFLGQTGTNLTQPPRLVLVGFTVTQNVTPKGQNSRVWSRFSKNRLKIVVLGVEIVDFQSLSREAGNLRKGAVLAKGKSKKRSRPSIPPRLIKNAPTPHSSGLTNPRNSYIISLVKESQSQSQKRAKSK